MKYVTDGMIVRDEQGDCMGIFSTVSLLNDKEIKIKELETKLEDAMTVEVTGRVLPDGEPKTFRISRMEHDRLSKVNYDQLAWKYNKALKVINLCFTGAIMGHADNLKQIEESTRSFLAKNEKKEEVNG